MGIAVEGKEEAELSAVAVFSFAEKQLLKRFLGIEGMYATHKIDTRFGRDAAPVIIWAGHKTTAVDNLGEGLRRRVMNIKRFSIEHAVV